MPQTESQLGDSPATGAPSGRSPDLETGSASERFFCPERRAGPGPWASCLTPLHGGLSAGTHPPCLLVHALGQRPRHSARAEEPFLLNCLGKSRHHSKSQFSEDSILLSFTLTGIYPAQKDKLHVC